MTDAVSAMQERKDRDGGKQVEVGADERDSPENSTWSRSRTIAGTQVTSSRKIMRIASLPAMYSTRVSGFDR